MRWLVCIVLLMSAPISVHADPVIDIADPLVEIRSFFSGADIFVFGAATCAPPECDIVVAVEGPPTAVVVRKKEKIAGIWVNARAQTFNDAPGYFGLAATRALTDILPPEGLAALHLPHLAAVGATDLSDEDRGFRAGLIDSKVRAQLWQTSPSDIMVREGRLFRARLAAPAAVPVGEYAISVITIEDQSVTGRAQTKLVIKKAGFEAIVSDAARTYPLAYAVISVFLALTIGFASATVFTRR